MVNSMQAIRTKAQVSEKGMLDLFDLPFELEQGNIVEVIILFSNSKTPKTDWRNILAKAGTYTEEELAGFAEVRKELDRWQPTAF